MRAVANSTPLIHLSKAGALRLLFEAYDDVLIPRAIYREVAVVGPEKGFKDTALDGKAVEEGLIKGGGRRARQES